MSELSEDLRRALRHWVTGVSVVTSQFGDVRHGMTVNSLASVSLEPPVIVFTLEHSTRTYQLVSQSRIAGITFLNENQIELSNRFAGKTSENVDRFTGLETFTWVTGAPLIAGGTAYLDCRVRSVYPLDQSTLFILDVVGARPAADDPPLVYSNRQYHRLCQ